MHNLSSNVVTVRTSIAVVAGTSEIDTTSVDTAGFEGCRFIAAFGVITSGAATSIKVQQAPDNSTWTDVLGTSQTVVDTADTTIFISDIYKPQARYLRLVVLRATQNAVLDGVIAELYLPRQAGVAQDATTTILETFSNPAAGTA